MEALSSSKIVTISVVSMEIDGLATMACRSCGAPLDVSQPDPNVPDRFLATCPDCLGWYLVETTSDQTAAWVAELAPLAGLSRPQDLRSGTH